MSDIIFIFLLVLVLSCYFAPAIFAFHRQTGNRYSVAVLNLFLGWTMIGWVIALAMAVSGAPTH